jgi:2-polyprenyl-6-methoxyphenol hydroxylase-like FAD-dependent oxidoreductase
MQRILSPFKGQGANQALLDALALARAITQGSQEIIGKRRCEEKYFS